MNPKLRKVLIFLTLPIVVIWAIVNLTGGEEKKPAESVSTSETLDPDAVAVAPEQTTTPIVKSTIKIEEVSDKPWSADPFRANGKRYTNKGTVSGSASWVLKGIVHNDNKPMAYINRQAVSVGDVIDNARVLSIDKRSVVLEYRDRHIRLQTNKG